jgi:hypothetical protein
MDKLENKANVFLIPLIVLLLTHFIVGGHRYSIRKSLWIVRKKDDSREPYKPPYSYLVAFNRIECGVSGV